ncbi:AsmA family protein [Polymorphobacter arshaanensis]|nr:AsmA family protein [Polymorphobacter arshaanensis]
MDATPTISPRATTRLTPLRILGGVALVLLALCVAAYAYLYVTRGRFLKGPFVRVATEMSGRAVTIDGDFQLYLDPHIRFVAEGLRVANPGWAHDPALVTTRHIDLSMNFWSALFGNRAIRSVIIDGGAFGLERDKRGRNSWSFDSTAPLDIPPIDVATVTGTGVHYRDDLRRIDVKLRLGDIAATDKRIERPLTFTGSGTAMGAPFKVTGALTTPQTTITGGRTGLDLHVTVADTKVDVTGTLPGATRLDGADLRLVAAGRNLQTPFALIGITVPQTRPYRISAALTKSGDEFRFTRIGGKFGDSDIAGKLTIRRPEGRLRIDGALSSKVLDILDIGPWLGYSPERLDAMGGKGAVTVVAGRPRVLPDTPLAIDGLRDYDAHLTYTAARLRTGTAVITGIDADVTLDHSLLRLAPVAFNLAGGRMVFAVLLNARVKPVVTDYDVLIGPLPLGRLLSSFDVVNSGTTATVHGRIKLRGTGDTVRKSLGTATGRVALVFPTGTLWVRNVELAKLDLQNYLFAVFGRKLKHPTEIRCGLIAFTMVNGIGTADPILFDTKRAVFRGTGQINVRDETMALSVQGDSKEFSLFSGQSPIAISGSFVAPRVNPISGKLIGRAAAAVALGVALTPVAAILAFVDLGDGKDTDCAPVLAARHG